MSAMKDPTIKLFGKTIPCPQRYVSASAAAADDEEEDTECCKEMKEEYSLAEDRTCQNDTSHQDPGDGNATNTSSRISDNMKTASESASTFEITDETSISEAKTLMKPNKILPCPRCNSTETKFCYYNNYNPNQPRHFCKSCQRYWTAGGSMRNVPVGSGRRKNKHNSTSHYRHIITSDTLQSVRGNSSTVLKFGSDVRLCDSMASVLSLSENTTNSSMAASSSMEKGNHASLQEEQRIIAGPGKSFHQGYPVQVPCFPGPNWQFPWHSAISPPHYVPSGYPPIYFYPQPTFWSPWNQQPLMSPTSTTSNNSSFSSSLGKHSREGDKLNSSGSGKERCILVPKTLRIGDPNEAANSSIRATLRMQNEKTSSICEAGVFQNFQSNKSNNSHRIDGKSPVMQANPAALSRSLNFHERT